MKIKFHLPPKRYYTFSGSNVGLDWVYILTATVLLSIVFIIAGVLVSFNTNVSNDGSGSVDTTPPHLNKEGFNKIINLFDTKKSNTATYSAGYPGPADPSGM
jgi:hypothetical protein